MNVDQSQNNRKLPPVGTNPNYAQQGQWNARNVSVYNPTASNQTTTVTTTTVYQNNATNHGMQSGPTVVNTYTQQMPIQYNAHGMQQGSSVRVVSQQMPTRQVTSGSSSTNEPIIPLKRYL